MNWTNLLSYISGWNLAKIALCDYQVLSCDRSLAIKWIPIMNYTNLPLAWHWWSDSRKLHDQILRPDYKDADGSNLEPVGVRMSYFTQYAVSVVCVCVHVRTFI